MTENEDRSDTNRWVIADYIVYCQSQEAAQRVYEAARDRADRNILFGAVVLDDGVVGRWVVMSGRKTPGRRAGVTAGAGKGKGR